MIRKSESRDWDEWPLIGNEIFNEDREARMVGTRKYPHGVGQHDRQITPPINVGQSDDAESEADSGGGQGTLTTQINEDRLSVETLRNRQAVDPFVQK